MKLAFDIVDKTIQIVLNQTSLLLPPDGVEVDTVIFMLVPADPVEPVDPVVPNVP